MKKKDRQRFKKAFKQGLTSINKDVLNEPINVLKDPPKAPHKGLFLKYQKDWLNDKSQIKIWEKSRRIGATYVQAYEDVRDALTLRLHGKPCDVWFSSADITAAKEYIMYCAHWAKVLNEVIKDLGEIVIDEEKDVKALTIEFKNGARINALSSNPTQFRSKGGKVVLDEFAHHKDQQAMWTAASASALIWGYPIRILSTHNGQNSKFYEFIEKINKGKFKWGLHRTTIIDAVEDGLADKILHKALTKLEREEWLNFIRENAGDEITWLQEYMCDPVDESTSFLSYALIESCELDNCLIPLATTTGDLYTGMDIARERHLTAIETLEKLGDVCYLRNSEVMQKTRFKVQEDALYNTLQHKNLRRAQLDTTGIGKQLGERAQEKFGKWKVEASTFTPAFKSELAYLLYTAFEDRLIRIPPDPDLRADLHSIKKFVTKSGNIRFDSDNTTDGHGDRFWALALAYHASINKKGVMGAVKSSMPRRKNKKRFEYDYAPFKSLLRQGMY